MNVALNIAGSLFGQALRWLAIGYGVSVGIGLGYATIILLF